MYVYNGNVKSRTHRFSRQKTMAQRKEQKRGCIHHLRWQDSEKNCRANPSTHFISHESPMLICYYIRNLPDSTDEGNLIGLKEIHVKYYAFLRRSLRL